MAFPVYYIILYTLKRQISAWDLFMRIMRVKCWSHKFVLHKFLSHHNYVTMHKALERINLSRGPFWQICINFSRIKISLYSTCIIYFKCLIGQSSGDLRLVARDGRTSPSLTAGRLEVYYSGQWGTVCDDNFQATEARIACNQLGFSEGYLDYDTVGTR